MAKIKDIIARQIFDSRGNPTVEVDVITENLITGRAAVPSGASTGEHEAVELRDGGSDYHGKGVLNAVSNINNIISKELVGRSVFDQISNDHLRHMVGGRINQKGDNNERIFRGEFPEKPGALLSFLEKFGSNWNISLFHYRNLGSAFGKIFKPPTLVRVNLSATDGYLTPCPKDALRCVKGAIS